MVSASDCCSCIDEVCTLGEKLGFGVAAGTKATHNIADCQWSNIVGAVFHPAAHRRFDRQIMIAHQYLAGTGLVDRAGPDRESGG